MATRGNKAGKTKTPAKMGRPSKYSEELAQEICDRIALGESEYSISMDEHMPDRLTMIRWRREKEEFRNQYALAKEEATETNVDLMLHTARTEEDVNRARLIVDTMKWQAMKLKPKKYGDKIDMTSDGKALPQPIINLTQIAQGPTNTKREIIEHEQNVLSAESETLTPQKNIMDDIQNG